jgi:hypothetical protein
MFPNKRKRAVLWIGLAAGSAIILPVLLWGYLRISLHYAQKEHLRYWTTQFSDSQTTLAKLKAHTPEYELVTREFPDHSWVAAAAESTCSAGFDSMILRDEAGHLFQNTTYHFCGYEGLSGTIYQVQASSSAEFLKALPSINVYLTPVPPVPHE